MRVLSGSHSTDWFKKAHLFFTVNPVEMKTNCQLFACCIHHKKATFFNDGFLRLYFDDRLLRHCMV